MSIAHDIIKNQPKTIQKRQVISAISKIKKFGIKIQEELDGESGLNDVKFDNVELTGIFSALSDSKGATRVIFPQVKTDSGTYVNLGIFSKRLALFNNAQRPITVPAIIKTDMEIKDFDASENVIADLLLRKFKTQESRQNLIDLVELLENFNIKDAKTAEKNKNEVVEQ